MWVRVPCMAPRPARWLFHSLQCTIAGVAVGRWSGRRRDRNGPGDVAFDSTTGVLDRSVLLLFSCLRDTVLLVLVVLCAMRLCGAGMSHGCATSVQVHQPMSTSSSVTDLFFLFWRKKKVVRHAFVFPRLARQGLPCHQWREPFPAHPTEASNTKPRKIKPANQRRVCLFHRGILEI